MKKNKLLKTGALALGTVASIAAPIAAVVSCGGGYAGRYETDNDGVIKVMESFSAGGKQEKPLLALIDYYNDHVRKAGDMKVEHVHMDGGYGSMEPFLRQSFEAGDTKKIPNLMINYPDSIGALVKYKMQLKLDDSIGTEFNTELIDQANANIGGIDDGGLYAVPFAKSTDMQIVNDPVMAHIAKELGYDQNVINIAFPNAGTGDEASVAAIYGTATVPTSFKTSKYKLEDLKTNSSELLKFIAEVTPFFKTKQHDAYILGIDAAANFIYQNVYSKVGDMSKFIFSKGPDGYIKYNWADKNTDAYKAFAEVYGALQAALKVGGVYIGGNGAYTSAKAVLHQVGISYGSTAGYSHDFLDITTQNVAHLKTNGGTGDPVATISLTDGFAEPVKGTVSDVTELLQFGTHSNNLFPSTSSKAGNYDLTAKDAKNDTLIAKFLTDNSSEIAFAHLADKATPGAKNVQEIEVVSNGHDKKMYLFTSEVATDIKTKDAIVKEMEYKNQHLIAQFGKYKNNILDDTAKVSGYDTKVVNSADVAKLRKFISENSKVSPNMFFSDEEDIDGNYPADKYVKFEVPNKTDPSKKKYKFLLISTDTIGTEGTLQEKEIEVKKTPVQFGEKGTPTQLLQGPSVIGVHANAAEDANTEKFVEWFFGDEKLKDFADHPLADYAAATDAMTPAQYFAGKADYIVPTKAYLGTTGVGLSKGAKLAFDTIKGSLVDNDGTTLFDNPVDDTTGPFRTNMESTLMQQYNAAHAGDLVRDAAGIYSDIQKIGQ